MTDMPSKATLSQPYLSNQVMAWPQNDRLNRPDNLHQIDEVGIFTHRMPFKMGNPLQPSVYVFFHPYEYVRFLYHFNPMFFVSVLYAIELNRIYFHGAIIADF